MCFHCRFMKYVKDIKIWKSNTSIFYVWFVNKLSLLRFEGLAKIYMIHVDMPVYCTIDVSSVISCHSKFVAWMQNLPYNFSEYVTYLVINHSKMSRWSKRSWSVNWILSHNTICQAIVVVKFAFSWSNFGSSLHEFRTSCPWNSQHSYPELKPHLHAWRYVINATNWEYISNSV